MKFRIPTAAKGDFYPLFFLVLLFSLLAVVFVGHQGSALTDCFAHGAFVPSQVVEGKLLIRDVCIPYPPFSYQCQAFFLWIFGVHLNTIYGLGIVHAFVILLALYFIARSLTEPWTAWAVCFLVMTLCIFHYWIFNYIFPYAPAMLYALSSLLFSLLCCISYIRTYRPKILVLSFFFLGISLASKFDFFLFLPILFSIALFFKPLSFRYLLLSIVAVGLVPSLSWGFLFYQGLTLSDIVAYFEFLQRFMQSSAFQFYYAHSTGFTFAIPILGKNGENFLRSFLIFGGITITIYPILFWVRSQQERGGISLVVASLLKSLFVVLSAIALFLWRMPPFFLSFIGMTTALILVGILFSGLFQGKGNGRERMKLWRGWSGWKEQKTQIFILISLTGIVTSFRSIYYISVHSFGSYLLPLLLIVHVIFLLDYLPSLLQTSSFVQKLPIKRFGSREVWRQVCLTLFLATGISFSSTVLVVSREFHNNYPLRTERGTFYTDPNSGAVFEEALRYLHEKTSPKDTLWMIPHGPILNFLVPRPALGNYYDFIPPVVQALGEERILENLQKNPPTVIFITSFDCREWGAPFLGQSYAVKIHEYILRHYRYEGQIEKGWTIWIFRKH